MTDFTVKAGSTDLTNHVDIASLLGTNDLTARVDTLQFTMRAMASNAIGDKQDVTVTDQAGTAWFGGIVGQIDRKTETRERLWDITVQGYAALLDTTIVNAIYANTTDHAIVTALLATYLPEITPSFACSALPVNLLSLPYKPLSACMDNLVKITGRKYYVTPGKVLVYFDPTTIAPSLTLTDTSPDLRTTWSYEDWAMQTDDTQLQNRVYVVGGQHLANTTKETFYGDGSTTVFTLSQRPNKTTDMSLTPPGASIGFGHTGVDSYGGSGAILALVDDALQTVTFETAPGMSVQIDVSYDFYQPVLAVVTNTASYGAYGRWYDGKVQDATIQGLRDALTRGGTVLSQYAFPLQQIKLRTRAPWLRSGSVAHVVNTPDGINGQYLCQSTQWKPVGNGIVVQDVTLIG